jgi:hypothetical protein
VRKPLPKNTPMKGPLNRRSLGSARDDKGEGEAPLTIRCWSNDTVTSVQQQHIATFSRFEQEPALQESVGLPFVIPSEAEGPAVSFIAE